MCRFMILVLSGLFFVSIVGQAAESQPHEVDPRTGGVQVDFNPLLSDALAAREDKIIRRFEARVYNEVLAKACYPGSGWNYWGVVENHNPVVLRGGTFTRVLETPSLVAFRAGTLRRGVDVLHVEDLLSEIFHDTVLAQTVHDFWRERHVTIACLCADGQSQPPRPKMQPIVNGSGVQTRTIWPVDPEKSD